MEKSPYIEAGRITNTHGVSGEVKIEVWLDSPQFLRRCGRVYLDGTERRILSGKIQKQFLIAKLEGVEDVNAAMCLKGRTVSVRREDAALRETEEELLISREEIDIVAELDPVCGPSLGLVWPFVGVWKGHATIDMPSRAGDVLSFLAAEAESTSLSRAADPTPLPLRWSEAEVDHTFLIPFSWFLEQEPIVVKTEIAQILPDDFPYDLIRGGREYNWQVKARNLYFYRHPEAVIWGVTAEIIHDLVTACRAERCRL